MADETTIKWLYPSNFEGTYPKGQNTGHIRHTILCTNISDGSGEDEVIKVKRTDLLTPTGIVPSKLIIEKIDYDISGMSVKISYNNINDEEVAVLTDSSGCIDFTKQGGFNPENDGDGDGGDIIFTTINSALGDTYNIILTIRPHE